jgi:hypothetical protein
MIEMIENRMSDLQQEEKVTLMDNQPGKIITEVEKRIDISPGIIANSFESNRLILK